MSPSRPPTRAGRREWIGLAVLALPSLIITMDLTVLYLAVPELSADLKPSSSQLLWITDIYGFFIAGALITMGTLGDRIGRRRLLLIGAVAFGATSILAAFSTSAEMLIVTRALLGIAGATLMPSTLSLIRSMFHDPGQRTVAIGVWATSLSVGAGIGPLLGGAILELFWWGAVFLVSVPVVVLLLAVGPRLLPEFRDPNAGRLDLSSAALSLVAVLTLIYGIKWTAQNGFGSTPALLIAAGLAIGIVFLRRQRTLAHPLIDVRLFRVPAFSASVAANALGILVILGTDFFIVQYLQLVLGMGPLEAGLWTLPAAGGFILGSTLMAPIARRVRPAFVVAGGLALAAVGSLVLTGVEGTGGLPLLVIGSVLMAVGVAQALTLSTDLIVSAAPPERAGAASAISETGTELGGALGVAILGSIGTAVYRGDVAGEVPDGVAPEAAHAARDTLGGAAGVADQLPASLIEAANHAFAHGLQVAALTGAVLMVGMAVAAALLLPQRRAEAEPEPEAPKAVLALAAQASR